MMIKFATSGLPLISAGKYLAKFVGYQSVDSQFGPTLQMKYEITDGENKGVVVDCLANQRLTPTSKLYTLVSGMIDDHLVIGNNFELDTLIGTECVVTVKTINGRRGDFSRIEYVERKTAK